MKAVDIGTTSTYTHYTISTFVKSKVLKRLSLEIFLGSFLTCRDTEKPLIVFYDFLETPSICTVTTIFGTVLSAKISVGREKAHMTDIHSQMGSWSFFFIFRSTIVASAKKCFAAGYDRNIIFFQIANHLLIYFSLVFAPIWMVLQSL
jgi:hypothetical protein